MIQKWVTAFAHSDKHLKMGSLEMLRFITLTHRHLLSLQFYKSALGSLLVTIS